MVIINPMIWLAILIAIYFAGILIYSFIGSMAVDKLFSLIKIVTFRRAFSDCLLGMVVGVIISVIIFKLFVITEYTGNYPIFNTRLLQVCCLLPAVVVIIVSLFSLRKQIGRSKK
jgi:uncharacterized protein (DUF2062 family)